MGEWSIIELDGTYSVNGLDIRNGYKKSSDLYQKNRKVKQIQLAFSDGSSTTYTLSGGFDETDVITLEHPIATSNIQFTILETKTGSKYDDTCITEISIW